MASYIGTNPPQQTGIVNRFQFTATAAQTVFSGADNNGAVLFYISSNPTLVFLNGVQLVVNTDYTQTDNNTITLSSGAALNDEVEIMGFGSFDLNNAATTRSQLGLGTAAVENVGTSASNVVQLDGSAALPAVDGSNLTGIATDVVDDTSPQLGGNLDVNGNDIVSVSNADIDIIPNGTGKTNFGGTAGVVLPSGTTAQRNTTTGIIRFNTTTGLAEYYDGISFKPIDSPPEITSISPTSLDEQDLDQNNTIVITGSNFSSGATVKIIGNDGTEITPASTTRNSATQITITTPTSGMTASNEPYGFKVTNTSGLFKQVDGLLSINDLPVFSTPAGSVGTLQNADRSASNLTNITATDEESDTITFSQTAGTLPTGITLGSDGTWSGTANAETSDTTYNFTVTATSGGQSATRDFSITVLSPINVEYLVIAGGGGGGSDRSSTGLYGGAGGGAGGYRSSISGESSGGGASAESPAVFVPGSTYTITVGAAGARGTYSDGDNQGKQGGNSSISGTGVSITSTGGGGAAGASIGSSSGGSGGGGAQGGNGSAGTSGQGYAGASRSGNDVNGGGGGAGGAGSSSRPGGVGVQSNVTGSNTYRAGGGGGASGGAGGSGGGGSANGGAGGTNTGGGGGGSQNNNTGGAGAGGSGVVFLKILTSQYTGTTTGSPSVSTVGSYKILQYNGSGSYTA